jgi:RIO kinase 2
MKRGHIKTILGKIGVGKESDIYKCLSESGEPVILKFQRLGRTSFRTVKNNRDYLQDRTNYNWLYISRLATVKEFCFMQLLHSNNFPTPRPIDSNRHGIVMSLVNGYNLINIKELGNPEMVFS